MAQRVTPVYFTDENTLGLGKLLRRSGREDVRYRTRGPARGPVR